MTKVFHYLLFIVLVFQPLYSMNGSVEEQAPNPAEVQAQISAIVRAKMATAIKVQIPGTVRIINSSNANINLLCHRHGWFKEWWRPQELVSLRQHDFNYQILIAVHIPGQGLFSTDIPKDSITNAGDYVITLENIHENRPKLKITCQEKNYNGVFNLYKIDLGTLQLLARGISKDAEKDSESD